MLRIAGAGGVLAAALLLALVPPLSNTYAASPTCYVVNSLVRVAPDDPVPANPAVAAEVAAAGNEYEAVQVVVHGGDSGVAGVDMELAGALTGPGGATLPAGTVRLYREHYIAVTSRSGGSRLAKPGVYPDALVPFRNPFTGQALGTAAYPAAPFDVPAGANQPVYVEFHIPPGTRPGVYRGAIEVTSEPAVPFAVIPVSVRVRRFTLPAASSLHTAFQSYDSDYRLGPAAYYGYRYGGPRHVALATAIDEMLIAHRLMPEAPMGFRIEPDDLDPEGNLRLTRARAAHLLSLLKRPEFTDYSLSFAYKYPFDLDIPANRRLAVNYLRSVYEWFRSYGIQQKLFIRPGDEPATRQQFQEIRELAGLARAAHPEFRVGMTIDFHDRRTAQFLYGNVNRLIALYASFDPAEAAARRLAGDEIWTYTALVQNRDVPSPHWEIDFPLLNYRVVNWINFRYGITGLLYWTSAYWNQLAKKGGNPWSEACNYGSGGGCYNGEGLLVYPGREVNLVVPRNAYGARSPAAAYGVVPSLRLKTLRDAVEDYEYLVLAARTDPQAANREAIEVGCAGDGTANCFHHWNTDPQALLAARERLASLIETAAARRTRGSEGRTSLPATGGRR